MTRGTIIGSKTPFSEWIRENPSISSEDGFVATDLDFIYANYKMKKEMVLEERKGMTIDRLNAFLRSRDAYGQLRIQDRHDKMMRMAKKCITDGYEYYGFHILLLTNTTPVDGDIYLDGKKITLKELNKFLKFQAEPFDEWYKSFDIDRIIN